MAYNALGYIGSMENSAISEAVIQKLPNNTFTGVRTFKCKHYFDEVGDVECRRIELTRTTVSCAFEGLRCFFLNLFSPDGAKDRYGNLATNKDKILEFILEGKAGSEAIKQAFICCKTVKIYVTEDCEYADIELLDSKMLLSASISGQIGRLIIENPSVIANAGKGCILF